MKAKEILSQYRFKVKKAEQTKKEYEDFMTRATKVTAVMEDAPARSNKVSDKVGENAIKLADLSREWQTKWLEAEEERLNIITLINKVDEPYRIILLERYIHEKNFEEISVELKYSYAWTTHLHGEALEEIEKIIKKGE